MSSPSPRVIVSVPYPVRLFGDLQDSLGLPALMAAVDVRTAVGCVPRGDAGFTLRGDWVEGELCFDAEDSAPLAAASSALSHAFRKLHRRGLVPRNGCDFTLYTRLSPEEASGEHPVGAVAWILTLLALRGRLRELTGEETAELLIELLEDSPAVRWAAPEIYACVLGGVFRFDPAARPRATPLDRPLPGLIIASCPARRAAPARASGATALAAVRHLERLLDGLPFVTASFDDVVRRLSDLAEQEARLAYAHLVVRDHCRCAWEMLAGELALDDDRFGELLDDTDDMLRDYLGVREPGIEMIMDAAVRAGALGCKVVPGTATFLAFAPTREDEVIEAIRRAGGRARRAPVSDGMRVEVR